MAVFGVQLVVTMVMASVMSKIIPHYSLARWFLCSTGLIFYLHPTDEELRNIAGIPKDKGKKGKGSKGNSKPTEQDDGVFTVPRNLDISLEKSIIVPTEVMQLKYYPEYMWLMDFSVCAAFVYFITEVYLSIAPAKTIEGEVNLSMLWCLLVIGFSLKIMLSLTMMYFKGDDSGGEKAMVVLSFFTYLLVALGMLIIDENKLELGLDLAYTSFNQSAASFLRAQGLSSDGPASKVSFKIALALMCALIGSFFTFPGLRLGKMHWDSIRYSSGNKILSLLFHTSFIAPIFLVMMWVKPLSRRYFTEYTFPGHTQPLISSETFDIIRISLIIIVAGIRLCMMPYYLQSYLNMAYEKVEEQKREAGRISNRELQKKVAGVFYYLCVVTLQYVTPIMLCVFLSFMFKTLGGSRWGALLGGGVNEGECGLNPEDCNDVLATESPAQIPTITEAESVMEATKILSLGLEELKKVFTTEFYRGIFGFTTWWCVFSWFLSGTFGVAYQSYFTRG